MSQPSPSLEGTEPTLANWQDPPYNRWAFSHLNELVPTFPISRGHGPVSPLGHGTPLTPSHPAAGDAPAVPPRPIGEIEMVRSTGEAATVEQVWEETYTDAVVVLHHGAVVEERYRGEGQADRTHLLMSVSKSVVSCVIGCLVAEHVLDPTRTVGSYLPELAGSGYEDAPIQTLLDMRSGVAFSEQYQDLQSDVRVSERAIGWRPLLPGEEPGSMHEFLKGLRKEEEHGGTFRYRSCETDVLGWVAERAAGDRPMAELISSLIWQPMGAEHDAEISCDGVGSAIHDGGICAVPRDLARFGLMLQRGGRVAERKVVPGEWIGSSWTLDADLRAAFAASDSEAFLPGGWYHNQFWFVPRTGTDVLVCLGIYGQMVYVNPYTGVVGAKLSSWPAAQSPVLLEDTMRAFDAIGIALTDGEMPTHEGLTGVAAGLSRSRGASPQGG